MHHKALLSPSSVEKEVSWLSNKRAKKIQDGWNFRAGETEEREDSLGFARSTRIPVLGLYLNSRAHIRYVSASSFLIFFFFFLFTLSEGPGKPYFPPLPLSAWNAVQASHLLIGDLSFVELQPAETMAPDIFCTSV